MTLNKITLAFPDAMEKAFRKKYYQDSIGQFRIAFLLVTIIYGCAGFLDVKMDRQHIYIFHFIRYIIILPSFITVFLISFHAAFQRIWQEVIFASLLLGGFCAAILTLLASDDYAYYAGMMLIFSSGYFFVKLRFLLATIAGSLILVFLNVLALTLIPVDMEMLVVHNFFFVATNLIGMFAAYNIEIFTRKDFYLNQLLDRRNHEIFDSNKTLESKVRERTNDLLIAKEKSEQSDKLKTAFLANMSHEIRTPMNGILGFAELLKEPNLTGDEQTNYIGIIVKSGKRMLNIINNIVDISKIESGLMEVMPGDLNINQKMEFVHNFFMPEAKAKGIQLSVKYGLPLKDAFILSDSDKIYAIFVNLIKNAIKYTNAGSIEFGYNPVETDQGASFLEFYVKDTGIGIPDDRQSAIFERFIQADIQNKMARQGAGLGLTISKSYVEMIGGKIWVESQEEVGSTFYFTIPYVRKPIKKRSHLTINSAKSIDKPPKRLNILIAEDDEDSEELLTLSVKKMSNKMLIARTGVEAVEACRNNPDLDLILMDIQMPVMDGYQATRQIRQFNKEVVILAQTAYALSGDFEKAMEAGCNDYLTKPVQQEQLENLIEKHFEKKEIIN